jgi:hypothetical protein
MLEGSVGDLEFCGLRYSFGNVERDVEFCGLLDMRADSCSETGWRSGCRDGIEREIEMDVGLERAWE